MSVELSVWGWPGLPAIGNEHHCHHESRVNEPGDRCILLGRERVPERLPDLQRAINEPPDCGLDRITDRTPISHGSTYYDSRQSVRNPPKGP